MRTIRIKLTSPDVRHPEADFDPRYGWITRMKTLICPNCSTQIPLEEAVTHQIREELQRQFQAAAARREQALSNRELKLAGMQAHLDKRAESLDEEIEQRLQAEADQI
jgi:hypothetical protein